MFGKVSTAIATGMLCLLAACQREHAGMYQPVPEEGWERGRSITFEAAADGAAWTTLHLRTTAVYPYSNLALQLRSSAGCDTVSVSIGAPHGTRLQQSSAPLPRPLQGRVEVRQIMNQEILTGIADIGLE